jgi:tetratricopeptide (TPR) repeat protein
VADSLDDLAYWLVSRNFKREEADSLARKAIAIRRKLLGADNLLVTVASLRLQAADLDAQGNSSEERATLYRLVEAQRKLYGDEHPTLAQSLNSLASVLRNENKLAESEPVRREALAMQRKFLGEENPEVAQTLSRLAELLVAEHKPAEAEPLYRSSLMIRQKIFGDDSALAADSLSDLGKLLQEEGKMDDARNLYLDKAGGTSASAAAAQYHLGGIYLHGKGVPKDETEGAMWFRESADLGNTSAQIELGELYFEGIGVPKDEDEALRWFRKAAGSGNILATRTLADCYYAAGRSQHAIALLEKISGPRPKDTDLWLTLAQWQIWFGKEDDYENTRLQMIQIAAGTHEAGLAQGAAKLCCLRPSTNAFLLAKALELARLGVEIKKGAPGLPWYQMALGLAEFRSGQYAEAEQTLAVADQNAGKFTDIPAPCRFFRALSLYQIGRTNEARELFSQAEAQMPPLPEDSQKPVIDGKAASHDVVLGWLAYKEAKSVLYGPDSKP